MRMGIITNFGYYNESILNIYIKMRIVHFCLLRLQSIELKTDSFENNIISFHVV